LRLIAFARALFVTLFLTTVIIVVTCVTAFSYSSQQQTLTQPEEPVKVSPCELSTNPRSYNHKLIEITGFISDGRENSHLIDPTCESSESLWWRHGGKSETVEGIHVPLIEDARFNEFGTFLERWPDSLLRATVVGRFFAGTSVTRGDGRVSWGGYGHRGCCSLFVLQQVLSVDASYSKTLDNNSISDEPDIDKLDCGYSFLTEDVQSWDTFIRAQSKAESAQNEWRFANPKRVATDGLAQLLQIRKASIALRQTSQTRGRFVYEWRPKGKAESYMVVVSRPAWLRFYAKDPNRVAWVILGAFESSCSSTNSIKRLK
jgi:hypothetical protein